MDGIKVDGYICPECKYTDFDYHRKRAQIICKECGLVISEPYRYIKGLYFTPIIPYQHTLYAEDKLRSIFPMKLYTPEFEKEKGE